MTLSALFYLQWIKRGSSNLFLATLVFTALAAFTREEAYTLPLALPLIWWLSTADREAYWRPIGGAAAVLVIDGLHYALRTIFVSDAPQVGRLGLQAWKAVVSAWFPGGAVTIGATDRVLQLLWVVFLVYLTIMFFRYGDSRRRTIAFGTCILGLVLSTPALGVTRAFGVALPTLAFFTAISIAIVDVQRGFQSGVEKTSFWHSSVVALCICGLVLGVASGVRRSLYLAQSLDSNSVEIAYFNGLVLFGMFDNPETVPEARRQAALEHLATLGIRSREDVLRLKAVEKTLEARTESADLLRTLTPPIFAEKYQYLNF